MDSAIADLLGIFGFVFTSYGCWLIYPPAGYIVAGILLIAAAYLIAAHAGPESRDAV